MLDRDQDKMYPGFAKSIDIIMNSGTGSITIFFKKWIILITVGLSTGGRERSISTQNKRNWQVPFVIVH